MKGCTFWEGKIIKGKYGHFQVISYKNAQDIDIKFLDTGFERKARLKDIKTGIVVYYLKPTVYGVGIFGTGFDSKHPAYSVWTDMLRRCYGESSNRLERYKLRGVTVSDNFKKFQYFAKWYDSQHKPTTETFSLDKDILGKSLKVYSEETCCLIPKKLNNVLTLSNKVRGDLPCGVSYHKRDKKFSSTCCRGDKKKIWLGSYYSAEEAFDVYKNFKEEVLKTLAREYFEKGDICINVYQALMNYKVIPFPE